MPPLVDTHAHLTDACFEGVLPAVLAAAKDAGLVHIGVIGFDATTSRQAVAIAERNDRFLFASVGIQPNSAAEAGPDDWPAIERLSKHPSVHALGETGIDLHWKDTPLDIQQDYFERHIELSKATGLPLVIHLRESGKEIVDQLRSHASSGRLHGVMHSFTGDLATCKACLDLGLYISFAGMVTFKKSTDLRAIAAYVPADRLLVETDSPYLSPEPFRGKRPNEPDRVLYTLRAIADERKVKFAELAHQTTDNARHLFRLQAK